MTFVAFASFGLLLGYLAMDVLHVDSLYLGDERIEGIRGQSSRFAVEHYVLAKDHQGWDGSDVEETRQLGLGLGVDLAEHDVGVLVGSGLEGGAEDLAWATPLGPEVDNDGVVVIDRALEVLFG